MLNKKLCGQMYQGVVKIVKINNYYKLVNLDEAGTALEFTVNSRNTKSVQRLRLPLPDGVIGCLLQKFFRKIKVVF
jgi:hypothetical protein